jgi:hypothetical protein
MSRHWAGLPYLDAIRPQPGWIVERAILATYSANLVAVVAALLALAGLDDDRGSGSKVDFANAYEQLRDRVRILVQIGQVGLSGKTVPIMGILDRFLCEVNQGSEGIWHPKAALLKFVPDSEDDDVHRGKRAVWHLWIGSRNLTRSLDWDTGLVLVSRQDGQRIPGIPALGAELARLAGLEGFEAEHVREELEELRWQSPEGTEVREVRLLLRDAPRGLPGPPEATRKLIVVSPFLDGRIVSHLGRWGDARTERTLLSTRSELAQLYGHRGQPLAGYAPLLALGPPEPEDSSKWSEDEQDDAETPSEDEEIEARGLHAKLIYAEHGGGRTLWLGSANATSAAWNGPNTEIVARLEVCSNDVAEGLSEFISMAQTVFRETLADVEETDEEKLLDDACKHVVAHWQVEQRRHPDGPQLTCDSPPHPDRAEAKLQVGLLTGALVPWPRGQLLLQLPPASLAQETELIQVRLSMGDQQRTWLQRAPLDPPPDQTRDRSALSRYLDPRTFLLWIRSLLGNQDVGDGGGDWDVRSTQVRRYGTITSRNWWAPTLEEMLKAWSRDPNRLKNIDQKVRRYLTFMHDQPDQEQRDEDHQVLRDFEKTWEMLCQVLLQEEA